MSEKPSPLSFDPSLVPLVEDGSGGYRLKGTRVSLDTVIEEYRSGGSVNTIIDAYRTLNWDDVYAVLQWYRQNGEAVDAHLRQRDEQAAALRREIEAKQGEDNLKERPPLSAFLDGSRPMHCWHRVEEHWRETVLEILQMCCRCRGKRVHRVPVGGSKCGPHTPPNDPGWGGMAPEEENVYEEGVDRYHCKGS